MSEAASAPPRPVSFARTCVAMVLAGGWETPAALVLWAAMAGRALPSVLYVRARLHLERGEPAARAAAIAAHAVAVALAVTLAAAGWLPWLASVGLLLLLVRAAWGLSPARRCGAPRAVGFAEIAWGVLTVPVVATGYWLVGLGG